MVESTNPAPIRVLIVDDHPMVRRGLKSLLSSYPDIAVVGDAEDGTAALQAVADLGPHVVLLDIQMFGLGGIEVASRILRAAPQVKIVILTAYDNEEYILGAFRVGCYAYLLKNSSDDIVVETIRLVHQGKRLLSPSLMDQVLRQLHMLAKAQVTREHNLSPDEIHVLARIANGATSEDIAKEIHWSDRTVKRKIEEIAVKLGAHNRAQAVAIAIREGLI
ncbi:MAG: response regulator transcription factor [Chloroflexi bacterium]|nr:response regulator transcription factor [Chloroflexota bacterium]